MRSDLRALIVEVTQTYGIEPSMLQIELTEGAMLQKVDHHSGRSSEAVINDVRSLGVRISIDDFGVGHSSFSYLRCFPFDEIKLDRSFVGALSHDPNSQAILRAFLTLGRGLGLDSIAEGVESAEQLSVLAAEGCRLAQGYYFSPPVHPHEINAMVDALVSATADYDQALELRQINS